MTVLEVGNDHMLGAALDARSRIAHADPDALRAARVDTVMLNVGLRCDLTCTHCHHECGPDRTESMPVDVALSALRFAEMTGAQLIDLTGGAPELWEPLRNIVAEARGRGLRVRMRTNLVSLGNASEPLAEFLLASGVTLLASMPGATDEEVTLQRGEGVFDSSVAILRHLNSIGYGSATGPSLELAHNPREIACPGQRSVVETEMRRALAEHDVSFTSLIEIANMPLGRLGAELRRTGRYHSYLHRLANAFNAETTAGLECRHGVEVAWDGRLADCDFNLAAGQGVVDGPRTITEALEDPAAVVSRSIAYRPHCFACTAGGGSG